MEIKLINLNHMLSLVPDCLLACLPGGSHRQMGNEQWKAQGSGTED